MVPAEQGAATGSMHEADPASAPSQASGVDTDRHVQVNGGDLSRALNTTDPEQHADTVDGTYSTPTQNLGAPVRIHEGIDDDATRRNATVAELFARS